MMARLLAWWRSPGVLESRMMFARSMADSIAAREALDAEERVGDSAPPGPRDSGPDILDGLTTSAHP